MVDPLSVDSIEGHNRESGKGFPTIGPRSEAGNVVVHRGLHISASCGSTRLICASFGSTRLICASFGSTRLICAFFGITRLIGVSFGITRLMCAFYGTTRLLCRVRAQRGADRREAGRTREGHMDASGSWDSHLHLMEFAYNNSYQATIGMAPFEALYGKCCRSLVCWGEVGEQRLMGPELVQSTNEVIQKIRSRMHTAQSRQKSYADVRRKDLEFEVGDEVFLKVAPMRDVLRFERRGKLSPRFVEPFEILERIGPVAYRVALPPSLSTVHNVFHVSMLRKYVPDPSHVVDYEPLKIDENLSYTEQPVEVLAREVKTLRNKEIPLVKVLWRNHRVEEATWEREDDMRSRYPELFEE
ncbi:pol protein [Cucumis melo var. makuwa]|uniref:Pol protein n=1 Tax=Cucumis melo var. makuwa TaxID=1194695 RepID=A0A5A7UNN7_CUCMM|nr:pol protein [Cucumis melo var. makuwa]